MLIRISLILAIIAALAAGTLNILQVRDKISTLATDRDTQRDNRVKAEGEREKAKKDLAKSEKDAAQVRQELADTKSEHDKAVATAAAQTKRADELSDKLAKATLEREDALTKLGAYEATSLTPDQVGKLGRALKNAQEAVEVAARSAQQRAGHRNQCGSLDEALPADTLDPPALHRDGQDRQAERAHRPPGGRRGSTASHTPRGARAEPRSPLSEEPPRPASRRCRRFRT